MKERWEQIAEKINALSLRERALVLGAALAVVYLVWDLLIFNPLAQAKQTVDSELQSTAQSIETMKQEEQALRQSFAADPDRDLRNQIAELESEMGGLDEQLAAMAVGLIPVEELAPILQQVLSQTGSLKLQRLQTLPVEPLELSVKAENSEENPSAGVYKHSVSLVVNGSYFQFLDYLKTLQDMKWRFYWEALHYELQDYPQGQFELKVYTLSTDEGLLGV